MKKIDIHPTTLVIMFLGIWGTIGIISIVRLIEIKADPAVIAIISGITGQVTGSMASMLSNAMKPSTEPVQATIMNRPDNPVPTTATEETEEKTE